MGTKITEQAQIKNLRKGDRVRISRVIEVDHNGGQFRVYAKPEKGNSGYCQDYTCAATYDTQFGTKPENAWDMELLDPEGFPPQENDIWEDDAKNKWHVIGGNLYAKGQVSHSLGYFTQKSGLKLIYRDEKK